MSENNQNCYEPLHKILEDVKKCLGVILCAEAGRGKSYTAMQLTKEAMKDKNLTVIIISPSTIWRRRFSKINCLKVGTNEFNPIIVTKEDKEVTNILKIDKKYSYVYNSWFNNLITSNKHLLLEVKYRNGRKIKHFTNQVLQTIYDYQEANLEKNNNYNHHYLIVLEEIQNSFGTYSVSSDDSSLELLTVFTQSRSDANMHYVALGQRLADISTKVVERLRPMIGLTIGENSLRKIKAQLPKELKQRVQELPMRHWIYLDGNNNPEIVIPTYRKSGKVSILQPEATEYLTDLPTIIKRERVDYAV